jgi:D-xylose transport system substrate-binding protein
MRSTTWVAALATVALSGGLVACGSNDDNSSSSSSGSGASTTAASGDTGQSAKKIALLLPESKTARYESQDRPQFVRKLKELCPKCTVIYSNADQDAAKQQQQAEAAITQGANVLVLDPVDAASAGAIVTRAKQSKIPVVSYDRLVSNAPVDLYISYDNEKVGKLQGDALKKQLDANGKKGSIVMINGAPTDNNAKLFKQGAHSVLDSSGYKIAKEYDTPDWSGDKAQQEMEQAITAVGKDKIVGVYAANDGTAGGAIAAMKGNGVDPTKVPVTGQDAELTGVQRIINGEQYMTIYKAVVPEAGAAAVGALDLANGKKPSGVTTQTDNGSGQIPSIIFNPVSVTKDNVASTIIKDGYWKASELCTGTYAAACTKLGLKAGA